jgi:hypothetical protein
MGYPPPRQSSDKVTFSPAQIRRIAVEAGVEPRTAAKFLRGQRVVSTCADRLQRAIVNLTLAGSKDDRR